MPDRDAFREQVREATDIAEVVGERVALRPAGSGRLSGLCPFHNETAPSFQVNVEKGFFHCFGCKESGDVFAFLMKRDGLSFVEALHALARRAGIAIPERDPVRAAREEKLREVNRKALDWYRKRLHEPGGAKALAYLKGRGLRDETMTEYGLGFAPDAWEGLSKALSQAGAKEETLLEAGLIRKGTRGGCYDFFRNRLIVPIFDGQGRAAGFAGRSLDGSEPKYVNSPDTPIYRKRSVLYGFHHQRPAIRRERTAVLFEGYFDCLSAWQAGITGAVAVCGTALTLDHAEQLGKQAREVVLAFDADSAGKRATRASIPVLLQAQLRVRVVPMTAGRDPDDVLREEGGEVLRRAIAEAPGFVAFLVKEARVRQEAKGDSHLGEGRAEAAREILEVIARAPRALDREEWLGEVAEPLGFSVAAAREELARLVAKLPKPESERTPRGGAQQVSPRREPASRPVRRPSPVRQPARRPVPKPPTAVPTPAERDLVRWVALRPEAVAGILRDADPEDLQGFASSALLQALKRAADEGANTGDGLFGALADASGEERQLLATIRSEKVKLNDKQSPQDCFAALRRRRLTRELERLQNELREGRGDPDEGMRELQRVSQELDALQGDHPD